MTRRIYHQVDGKLVEGPSPERWRKNSQTHFVVGDIQPYKIPGTDKYITSRSHHRAHLKAIGAEEVGNEKEAFIKQMRREQAPAPGEMQRELRTAIEQCRAGKAAAPFRLDPQIKESLDLAQVEKV